MRHTLLQGGGGATLKLLGRSALAIACGVVALGIDVLINMVASGTWSWQASAGVVVGAAAIGAAVDALRQKLRAERQLTAAKLAPWPGDDLLVERPDEKKQIVRALRSKRQRANVVILEGAGGYGKSTLARSVCTDPSVTKKYSGVYRVGCAEDAVTDFAIAGLVNGLLEDITGHRPGHLDPETAGQHLGRVLGQRGKALLFVDDVWTERQADPFLVGAKRCTRIVTTRKPALRNATRVPVGPMSARQSRDLLMRGLPPGEADLVDTDLLDRVISQTWLWPFILRLLNEVLVQRVRGGYALEAALVEILEHVSARGPVGTEGLDVGVGPRQSELVKGTLGAGLGLLNAPDAEARLHDLAVFPPGALVPRKLVAKLWADRSPRTEAEAASLCDRMADLSFFTITGGHLQLHDVMYEFLRSQLDEPSRTELADLLLDLLSQDLTVAAPTRPDGDDARTAWWEDGLFAEYVGDNVVLHMMEAGRQQEAEALVCDLRWVLHRLQTSGTTSVLDDLDRVRTDRALQLSGAVKRIAHMLGGATVRPDAAQFLLNALREEPEWAQQAIALQRERHEPMLVSRWPLPDNPGPALRHVYKIPSSTRHNDAVALSPDGSWLAMAGDSGLFIVDTTARLVTAAYRSDLPIDRIAIAPDGRIATLAIAGTITVHDAATGAVIAQGHDDGALWSIAFAPDGASLVTTGNDGRVKLWDARTGERLRGDDFHTFFPRYSLDDRLPTDLGSSVAVISGDGEWVVSGGARQVLLWSMPDGRPLAAFNAEPYGVSGLIEHVAVGPDRSWVAGSSERKIYVWNTETGDLTTTLEARGTVMALGVTRDGSHLASGDSEGALLVWESQRFTLTARLRGHGGVRSLGFSPDGQLLYSGGGGDARAWELRKATSLGSSEESTPVERVVASPAGTWVAVAVQGGDVHIRNAASGRVEATLTGHPYRVSNIAVAPDGTWLATESGGTLFIWDTERWALTRKFYVGADTGEVYDICASADSHRLFTVDAIAARAWDPTSGKMLTTMAGCLEEAEAVTFSHDGSWLAAGDYYGTIWVWNADTGNLHCTLGGGYLSARMRALAGAPENRLLACAGGGGGGGGHRSLGHPARRNRQYHSLRSLPRGHAGGDSTGRQERHDLRRRHKRHKR